MPAAAPLAPAGELQVRSARRELAIGEPFSFVVTLASDAAALLPAVQLVFPGFKPSAPPSCAPAWAGNSTAA